MGGDLPRLIMSTDFMTKKEKFGHRRFYGLILGLVTIGLLSPGMALAGIGEIIAEWVGYVIWLVLIGPQLLLLQLELWLLPVIASYNGFTNVPGVITGWGIMRDVANIFFVLILLVIAFATIMNIEKYGYRSLLKRLIVMAILVNFSMTIVGLMIDLSQVVMLSFVAAIKNVASGNIVVAFGLADVFNIRPGIDGGQDIQDIASYITTLLLGAIMIGVVVAVIGIFLLILALRIVKLWILVVMAPLAFLFYAFPRTQGYYSEWMEELTKNLIIGPVLAFFLWLSFTIVGRGEINEKFIKDPAERSVGVTGSLAKITTKSNITNFIIALAMLVGGLQQAAKTGGAGASFAAAGASRIKAGMQSRLRRVSRPVLGGAAAVSGGLGRLITSPRSTISSARAGLANIRSRAAATGGVKGLAKGVGTGILGASLLRPGKELQKFGLQAQGVARGFTTQGQKEEEALTANMSAEQRQRYYALKAGPIMGVDARTMRIKQRVDEGYYKDADEHATNEDGTPDVVRRNKYAELRADFGHLQQHGGTRDDDYISKLRLSNASLFSENDEELVRKNVREKGAKSTFENMNFANFSTDQVTGALKGGAKAAISVFLEQDAKVRKSIIEGMDKKEKDAFVKAIQAFAHDSNKVVVNGKVSKDSKDYKKLETLAHVDPRALAPAYQALGAAQREVFLNEAKKGVEGKEIAKLNIDDANERAVFVDLVKDMTGGQRTAFLAEASGKPKKELMVETQVQQGDIKVNLDNAVTKTFVKQDDIKKYFADAIANPPQGKSKSDVRKSLAKDNLDNAHLVYEGQNSEFVEFAKGLKKEELQKIDNEALEKIIIPELKPAMQAALSKEGYGDVVLASAPPKQMKQKSSGKKPIGPAGTGGGAGPGSTPGGPPATGGGTPSTPPPSTP